MSLKKAFAFVTAFALALSLVACGNAQGTDTTDDSGNQQSETTFVDMSVGIEDSGHFEDVDLADLVTLPDNYMSYEFTKADVAATENDWNNYYQYIAGQVGEKVKSEFDAKAEIGDTVSVDFTASVDGVQFEGGSASGLEILLGSGQYLEDLENGIIGHEAGEMFDVDVTFPENYGNATVSGSDEVIDLSGKTAQFAVVLNSIYTYTMDDEAIQSYFADENLNRAEDAQVVDEASMRAYFDEIAYTTNLENAVIERVVEESTVDEIPQSLIDDYVESEMNFVEANATAAGITVDEMVAEAGYPTVDDYKAYLADYCVDVLKERCIILAAAEEQGIEYDESLCEEYYGLDAETLYASYGKGYVANNTLCYQTIQAMVDGATITE